MSEVLRDDDPRLPELLARGWRVAHRSWGARLALPDERAPLAALVAAAEAQGCAVGEVGPGEDAGPWRPRSRFGGGAVRRR